MANDSLRHIWLSSQKSSDKWSSYLDIYDRSLAHLKNDRVAILEIGVQNGGFTEALARFFTNAEVIVGCDIDARCGEIKFDDPRIQICVGDASAETTFESIKGIHGSFDLIIDDGSHTSRDIITAFARYFPLLRSNGVFIVEDLHCSYWKEYEGGIFHPYSSINFFKKLADIVNSDHWGIQNSPHHLFCDEADHYDIVINDELLNSVQSVCFFDSVCIISKRSQSGTRLGARTVLAAQSKVADNLAFDQTAAIQSDQSGNVFSQFRLIGNRPVHDLFVQIAESQARLERTNPELAKRLATIESELENIKRGLSIRHRLKQFLAKVMRYDK
jgi:hypothetical protein